VQNEGAIIIEPRDQILAVPLRLVNGSADKAALEFSRGDATEEAGILHLRVDDPPLANSPLKPAPEGLDIGQFGHGSDSGPLSLSTLSAAK
jgi:hypothetical protein